MPDNVSLRTLTTNSLCERSATRVERVKDLKCRSCLSVRAGMLKRVQRAAGSRRTLKEPGTKYAVHAIPWKQSHTHSILSLVKATPTSLPTHWMAFHHTQYTKPHPLATPTHWSASPEAAVPCTVLTCKQPRPGQQEETSVQWTHTSPHRPSPLEQEHSVEKIQGVH